MPVDDDGQGGDSYATYPPWSFLPANREAGYARDGMDDFGYRAPADAIGHDLQYIDLYQ